MESLPRDPLAEIDALIEQQTRQVDAKFRLLDMDNFEKLAQNYEQLGGESDLSTAEIASRRHEWAALYRETIGVPIEKRHELRPMLEQLAETGERAAEEVIERIQHQTQNGLSSALGPDDGFEESVPNF